MKRLFVTAAAALLAAAMAWPAAADPIIYDNGGPDLQQGNDATEWVQAEDFILSEDALWTDAHFWTGEFPDVWDGTLQWYLFADAAGQPGGLLDSGSGLSVNKTATGNFVAGSLPEFEYDFVLDDPQSLLGATTYWFGLHLAADFNSQDGVYWETTSLAGNGHESHLGTFDNWSNNGYEHAFYLTGTTNGAVPEPASIALFGMGLLGLVGLLRRKRA